MSLSNLCIEQRNQEKEVLKKFILYGLAGSVALHGLLILSLKWLPTSETMAEEPIELIMIEEPQAEIEPPKPEPEPKLETKLTPDPLPQLEQPNIEQFQASSQISSNPVAQPLPPMAIPSQPAQDTSAPEPAPAIEPPVEPLPNPDPQPAASLPEPVTSAPPTLPKEPVQAQTTPETPTPETTVAVAEPTMSRSVPNRPSLPANPLTAATETIKNLGDPLRGILALMPQKRAIRQEIPVIQGELLPIVPDPVAAQLEPKLSVLTLAAG